MIRHILTQTSTRPTVKWYKYSLLHKLNISIVLPASQFLSLFLFHSTSLYFPPLAALASLLARLFCISRFFRFSLLSLPFSRFVRRSPHSCCIIPLFSIFFLLSSLITLIWSVTHRSGLNWLGLDQYLGMRWMA